MFLRSTRIYCFVPSYQSCACKFIKSQSRAQTRKFLSTKPPAPPPFRLRRYHPSAQGSLLAHHVAAGLQRPPVGGNQCRRGAHNCPSERHRQHHCAADIVVVATAGATRSFLRSHRSRALPHRCQDIR